MSALHRIQTKLADIFSPLDAEVLAASKEWAIGRMAAIQQFKQSAEAQSLRSNQWAYYHRLYDIAGGKTWYNVFDGRGQAYVLDFVTRNCEAITTKRNANIAQKLEKAGVSEIISESFTHTLDGFDGIYVVNTQAGKKTVTINTVRAGGHTIQCLHLRVLVKIK